MKKVYTDNNIKVSMVVPAKNSETTIGEALESIEKQQFDIAEIFLIDNCSTDSTLQIMQQHAKKSRFKISVFSKSKDGGLADSYNKAIKETTTPYLITLQSDCIIPEKNGIKKLMEPFLNNSDIIVSCSKQTTPWKIWNKYNFWQKCLFSRHVGKILSGRNGRFCCFKTEAIKKVGMFDKKTYRTAGEDGDILIKLSKIGTIVDADIVIDHLHSKVKNFSVSDYIYKENQLAEAVGACLSKNFNQIELKNFKTALLRPVLIIGLLIPILNIFFLGVIFAYSFILTKQVFVHEWKNYRILFLPFVNIFLLFSYTFFFLKGVIMKRQRL